MSSVTWSIGKTDRFKMTAEKKKNIFMQNVGPQSYSIDGSKNQKTVPKWR